MKKYLLKYLCVSFFVIVLGSSSDVEGQCNREIDARPFNAVSIEFRSELIGRFRELIAYKCDKDFKSLYRMLTPSFRELNAEKEFVKDYQFYYEGKDTFISFIPSEVIPFFPAGEKVLPTEKRPAFWYIQGCLTEKINGKKRSIKTTFEAIPYLESSKEILFFTDATTRPNPLGNNEKCPK